jgi:uncharacterized membrane protein
MPQNVNDVLQLIFRWAHVVAGVVWIGHLYFFNFVNGPFAAKIDAPTKKVVVPELMPRALYWFRWGAAWTWFTGILLGGLIYYHGRQAFEDPTNQANNPFLWLGIVLVILAVGFVIYNFVMKAVANVIVANIIVLALFAAAYLFLEYVGKFGGRSLYIHAGLIFGTIMALNVWMVIWPNQKRIINAVKNGEAPDPAWVKHAGLRSRHNTYMSVPLIFTMISNHYPTMYGGSARDICLAAVIAGGFFVVWLLYKKSAKVQGF